MIQKLKIKFIILTMVALLALLTIIVAGMNLINYRAVVSEVDEIMALLSQNRGTFPGFANSPDAPDFPNTPDTPVFPDFRDKGKNDRLPHGMSPETPYESRYFSVLLNTEGEVIEIDTKQIASVDAESATEYAEEALHTKKDRGFIGNYRYIRSSEADTVRITFLDCGRRLDSFNTFLYTSIFIALIGFALVSVVICFVAGKILRPVIESYEKQKQFITDAGHEIKTPLTVINANVDLLEMEYGQNESLSDIQQQTKRLTTLTNELVYLARVEEAENTMPMIEFPISEVVQETADPFRSVAQADGKTWSCEIQPMLTLNGNDNAIGRLVSILIDNALKYSPRGGKIELKLYKQNKSIVFSVYNTTDFEVTPANLERAFDRFYRADPSRNSGTGGHGIGLSVAKAIAEAHGGKIEASSKDGYSFQITVVLPI